jgi:hypothetical protein
MKEQNNFYHSKAFKMKIVKVTYTTNVSYAVQNQLNIKNVMADLQNQTGINYHACICADGKTFIHTAFFKTDEDQKLLNELPSFQHFQTQLKASGLEAAPKAEQLSLVGSSVAIF